jgi:hypothetical protein
MKLLKWLFVAIVCPLVVDAGSNGKLALFGDVQHISGVGGFFNPYGFPDPLWKPISQGPATGNQFPANWYRDDYSFNDFIWKIVGTEQMQSWLSVLSPYLSQNHINGPCIQLHYGQGGGFENAATFINYLQALAPYIPAGTYEIAANEVLNPNHQENGDSLLNALGGPGVTGYDGLIALIKLERQYLPGALLGLNEFDVCDWSTGGPPNTYNQQEAINVYKVLAQNGAALDWLGCEGYWGNFQPGRGQSVAKHKAAIDLVGSQLVTTKGTGAPNTIAYTEFTPGGAGDYSTQQACWNAFLTMFAADPYVFGVTGPWAGFRRSNGFSDSSWFYDDTNRGGTDPDGAATRNGLVPASLPWLQGWVPSNVGP